MKRLSLIIIHIFFFWCFVLIYNAKNYEIIEREIIRPYIPYQIYVKCEKTEEEKLQDVINAYTRKAYRLVNKYVGTKSNNCYKLAIEFITELKGFSDYELVRINEEDVMLGDLVFYSNNGKGQTHWSVYLDADTGLHGSWNGTTQVKPIYYERFTKPIFYRLERTK